MINRYIGTLLLHALGDTIGYKNGEWEFNIGSTNPVNLDFIFELICDFIDLGGINNIDLKEWIVSDDTVLHMAIAESFLKEYNDIDGYLKILTKKLITIKNNNFENRAPGKTTLKYINMLEKGITAFNYDVKSGGSGSAMRTPCIGLVFNHIDDLDNLIEFSIKSSKLTHNSAIGYLGGLTAALFTSFAIRNIEQQEWPFLLIKLLNSNRVKQYIGSSENKTNNELLDYNKFLDNWSKYIELRFDSDNHFKKDDIMKNLKHRILWYYNNFVYNPSIKNNTLDKVGSSGYCAVIMAYDCLMDAGTCWEKLVIYSMIHIGDSDTVGSIAASWFGALYGIQFIPENNLKYIEYKEKLLNLGKLLFNKFYHY